MKWNLIAVVLWAWSAAPVPAAVAAGLQAGVPERAGAQLPAAPPPGDARVALPIGELEADVRRNPSDPKPLVLLGLAYWNADDFPRALEAFQRAVQVGPSSAEAHNWLGVALMEKADLPGAVSALRKAVALDPRYGRAYSNLGSALVRSGDFREAVEVFEVALALEPNSLAAHMNLGVALREQGDLEGALQHLRRVAAGDPDNVTIQYELGQTLRQSGDLPGAVAAFERAIELDPELREGYYGLGLALKQQGAARRKPDTSPAPDPHQRAREAIARGDLDAARETLARSLLADGEDAEAHNLLGFVLGQQSALASALVHLERAVALRADSADARYNLGVALWYSGATERALAELRESVALDPAAGASHAFLGMVLRETGDLTGARASLQRAIALLPSTAAVYVDLGITYLRAGELDKAVGQFHAGLNLPSPAVPVPDWAGAIAGLRSLLSRPAARRDDPVPAGQTGLANGEAHNVLGLLLGRQGADGAEVADAFREAIRRHPGFAEAHNHLGLVLVQAGDDEGGIAALREAVRISPDYADALANLGAVLTPTDAEEAIRALEKAVALAPGSVKAQFNLAMAYGASPRLGPAQEIEQLQKVIALAPAFARAHLALGKARLRDGQVPGAVDALQEAVRLEPANGEARYQLGLALARAGRKDEAAAELRKGRELIAAGDRLQHAALDIAEGRAALDHGDLDQAATRFRRAIELRPESAEAHRHLGEVLERQGDASAASTAYGKALELNPADALAKHRLEALSAAAAGGDDARRIAGFEEYIRQGRFEDVEPLLAAYVKERPDSSWGWYALGYSLFAQQKIGEAIKALAKSLELDVRNAEAHKILGRTLMMIGRFDAAQVEFEQALRYKPDSAEIHYNLARLFSIQDNWEPARKAFEAALTLDPEYLEALDGLGFALEALGDDAGAVAQYEKAVLLNEARKGTFVAPRVNLSAYYNRTGDAGQALEHARKALELDAGSDRAWFQKGRAEERLGQLEAAVESINQAIVLNQRASSYYYVLAGLYRRLGWMDQSRQALESFKRLDRESAELEKLRRGAAGAAIPSAPPRGDRD